MEKALAREIKAEILTRNSNTFRSAYSTLRQLTNGLVIEWVDDEGRKIGLKDNLNNYFYIRYRADVKSDAPKDRTTSCHETELTTELRLVAWVNNGNEQRLKEVLLHDLITITFENLTKHEKWQLTKIYPVKVDEIISDPERIFKEETKQDKIQLKKGVTLLAIDFTLKFNYKPYVFPDLCLDRQICEVC